MRWRQLKKLIIIYANAGAGHRRAAEALYSEAEKRFPELEVRLFDILDYAKPIFKKSYPNTYLFMVKRCPWLWGIAFHLTNVSLLDPLLRVVRRVNNNYNCREFIKYLQQEEPDLVLTTHFLPNEIITALKKRGVFKNKLVTCLTDYYPHAFWNSAGVDLYFVPNKDIKKKMMKSGIVGRKIKTMGIPVHEQFLMKPDVSKLQERLQIASGKFTVLIASGGFGVGPVKELFLEIKKLSKPIQILIICGNNAQLQEELTRLAKDSIHSVKIYGFVENMDELMAVSDLLISKSGGLTTTEAMIKGLPLISYKPIPGQETANSRFLIRHGAGLKALTPREARFLLMELIDNPQKLSYLQNNIAKLGNPKAAYEIINFLNSNF